MWFLTSRACQCEARTFWVTRDEILAKTEHIEPSKSTLRTIASSPSYGKSKRPWNTKLCWILNYASCFLFAQIFFWKVAVGSERKTGVSRSKWFRISRVCLPLHHRRAWRASQVLSLDFTTFSWESRFRKMKIDNILNKEKSPDKATIAERAASIEDLKKNRRSSTNSTTCRAQQTSITICCRSKKPSTTFCHPRQASSRSCFWTAMPMPQASSTISIKTADFSPTV